MSDQTENQETGSDLDDLKIKATKLNIQFHPNIGLEKLQAKVDNHQIAPQKPVEAVGTPQIMTVSEITELQQLRAEKAEREAKAIIKPVLSKDEKIQEMIKEQSELIRIRVSCMNPNKRDWEGEMYTVANRYVKFKRYVPFNNDEGWHVEKMMLTFMQNKKCQIFFTRKDDRGNSTRHGKTINELNIEIMTPLTVHELEDLAQRQAMAAGSAEAA